MLSRHTLIFVAIISIFKTYEALECTTPNGAKGNCIPIRSCNELLQAIETLNDTQIKFAQKSQCGYEKTPLVCCRITESATATNTTRIINNLLPSTKYCGFQHVDDYATDVRNKAASIDEFPWLASLLFRNEKKQNIVKCSGALINDRYVLTAAHCTLSRDDHLTGVRLGEYNIEQVKDCKRLEQLDVDECTDPVAEFDIEQVVRHPEYSLRYKRNDIALLRLNESVHYSDFIRPICLPLPTTKLAKIGDTLTVSGWGLSSYDGTPSNIKKKVLVELRPLEDCSKFYTERTHRINITNKQTCTKLRPESAEFSCQGDSGGPVMFADKSQWHVEGIISFGSGCGILSSPDVNSNVINYMDWILTNIRA